MSDAMRVCPRHERAHRVSERCPWCEPDVPQVCMQAARRRSGDGLGATHTWSPDLGAWVKRYLEDA